MRLGIKKNRRVTMTNIEGKVLQETVEWNVYRSLFFGLVKLYLRISPSVLWKDSARVYVSYDERLLASSFTKEEAEELVKDIKRNPDKYVRYNY